MQTPEQWFEQLCRDAALSSEETAEIIAKVAKNEKLASRFGEVIKGQEDYQASLGRLKDAQKQLKDVQDWWGTAGPQYNAALQKVAEQEKELKNLRDGGIPPDPQLVTKEDLAAFVKDFAPRHAHVVKTTAKIVGRHVAKFGEEPDLDAIDKIAEEQGLPLEAAYDQYIKPRVEAKAEQERKDWEKRREQEIEKDLRSRMKLPAEEVPTDRSNLFVRNGNGDKKPLTGSALEDELVRAYVGASKG